MKILTMFFVLFILGVLSRQIMIDTKKEFVFYEYVKSNDISNLSIVPEIQLKYLYMTLKIDLLLKQQAKWVHYTQRYYQKEELKW